jgi:hypothetical protein
MMFYWGRICTLLLTVRSFLLSTQRFIIDPHGIAIHYKQQRIYWADKNVSVAGDHHGVLRSCNFDGSEPTEVFVFRTVDNHTVSTNLTDLVIDFAHNNTAFVLDSGTIPAVISTSLDYPPNYDNRTDVKDAWIGFYPARAVATTVQIVIGNPEYLALDDENRLVLWSDTQEQLIASQRYIYQPFDSFSPGIAFVPDTDPRRAGMKEYYPVGLVLDIGLGPALWDDVVECFGSGTCPGLAGNFVCECQRGYFGNCQARTCPLGRAWFHEPAVNDVAHDVLLECSNMGVCDRSTGQCACRSGYEGTACERSSCQGRIATASDCSGRGRCLSMRSLAKKHRDAYQSPAPVVYGSKASDPDTWDADMVYGCYPDQYGHVNGEYRIPTPSGPSLASYECPAGYNTRLLDAVYRNASTLALAANYSMSREVQLLSCLADGGYFTLSFRGEETAAIYPNTSAVELRNTLQALSTVGKVEVTYDADQSILCSTVAGYAPTVTFISQVGLVPLLVLEQNHLLGRPKTVIISRVQEASNEGLLECAGKGDCDFSSGLCRCWKNQGTSDGIGGPGDSGDCGYYIV